MKLDLAIAVVLSLAIVEAAHAQSTRDSVGAIGTLVPTTNLTGVAPDTLDAEGNIVPADYVVTPNGYFHPSCISRSSSTPSNDAVAASSPATSSTTPCQYPRFAARKADIHESASELGTLSVNAVGVPTPWAPISGGPGLTPEKGLGGAAFWFTAASQTMSSATIGTQEQWSVPAAPTNFGNEILSFWFGIEPSVSDTTIVFQPLLGWNVFNDHAWSISAWECGGSPNTCNLSANYIPVAVGDQIVGTVTGSNCNAQGVCSWLVTVMDASRNNVSVSNTLMADTRPMKYLIGNAFEVYNFQVNNCIAGTPTNGVGFTNSGALNPQGNLITSINNVSAWQFMGNPYSGLPGCNWHETAQLTQTVLGPEILLNLTH